MLQGQIRAFGDAGGDHEEGGRGDVRRHVDLAAAQLVAGLDGGGGTIDLHRIAEALEHALGVIAGRRWLGNGRLAFGIEARQQQAGFDLGAGHRHDVVHTLELALIAIDLQRRAAFGSGVDIRAHFPQRIGHAAHGALAQGGITGQHRGEVLAGQQAGQQAHGRSRVTDVDRPGRCLQTVQADAMNGYSPMVRPFDDHTHVAERLQGRKTVLAFQKTLDLGHTFGDGAEHDRAVGDGLVTRNADTTLYAGTGIGDEID